MLGAAYLVEVRRAKWRPGGDRELPERRCRVCPPSGVASTSADLARMDEVGLLWYAPMITSEFCDGRNCDTCWTKFAEASAEWQRLSWNGLYSSEVRKEQGRYSGSYL
jgi:hypothetical protein